MSKKHHYTEHEPTGPRLGVSCNDCSTDESTKKPSHTAEPWSKDDVQIWSGETIIARHYLEGERASADFEKAQINADRIVACVNACAGINPEAVPALLAALDELIPHVLHYAAMPLAHSDAHKHAAQARAAIRKATP